MGRTPDEDLVAREFVLTWEEDKIQLAAVCLLRDRKQACITLSNIEGHIWYGGTIEREFRCIDVLWYDRTVGAVRGTGRWSAIGRRLPARLVEQMLLVHMLRVSGEADCCAC